MDDVVHVQFVGLDQLADADGMVAGTLELGDHGWLKVSVGVAHRLDSRPAVEVAAVLEQQHWPDRAQ